MKKLFLMLAFLGSVVTTAFAENKPVPNVYVYVYFCDNGTVQTLVRPFELTVEEIEIWYRDAERQCG